MWAICADLYWDEDAVDEDSSQGCVAQDEAGIDNTRNEEDWHTHHEAPKQYRVK